MLAETHLRAGARFARSPAAALGLAAVLVAVLAISARDQSTFLVGIYLFKQDLPVLCGMAAAAALASQIAFPTRWQEPIRLTPLRFATVIGAVALAAWAGSFVVMMSFDMSRDEAMTTFAADLLREGRLVAPVSAEWQPYSAAMMPHHTHELSSERVWISGYLPINSVLRALLGAVADPALTGPLLLALGLAALFDVARRLWPQRPDAVAVTLLLALSSSQLLINAMTAYAMTGHFALNMVWLALFLRRSPLALAAALAIGFLAAGLHKMHFHAIFVCPFILWLMSRREWRTTFVYLVGYAAISWFWLDGYAAILSSLTGDAAGAVTPAERGGRQIMALASRIAGLSPVLWVANLLRFVAWQNVLLFPLAGLSLLLLRGRRFGDDSLLWPLLLACGIGLLTMVHQGHGYGYRYLHGLIGCFCLLAGYGWQVAVPRHGPSRLWAMLRGALAVTLLVLFPAQLAMSRNLISPHARLYRDIKTAAVDVVLVDGRGTFYSADLVQNSADPRDLPKIMDLGRISPAAVAALCRSGKRIALVDRRHALRRGLGYAPEIDEKWGDLPALRAIVDRPGCAAPLPL